MTDPTPRADRRPSADAWVWALVVLSVVVYGKAAFDTWGSVRREDGWFGVNALRHAGPVGIALGGVLAAALVARAAKVSAGLRALGAWALARPWTQALLAAGVGLVCLTLPTRYHGGDGPQILREWPELESGRCMTATHDEVLEKLTHAWFYCETKARWGWSIERSFQVSDALAAALGVTILWRLMVRLAPRNPALALCVALAGGWTQLWFGDVEVYTFTSVLLLAWLLSASRALAGIVDVVRPTLWLTLAMGFHLLSGFLLPALAGLWWVEAWVRGRPLRALRAVGAMAAVIAGGLWWLDGHGLPASDLLTHSHAFGMGAPFRESLAPWSLDYHLGMIQLLLLLFPGAPLLLLLAARGAVRTDADGRLLIGATACFTFFFFVWKAGFGPVDDWNLFANAVVPASVLLGRTVVQLEPSPGARRAIAALLALYALHTATWILTNATTP